MPRESVDELMIRRFVGSQRDGIGGFYADPVSGRWSWSDAAYEIFGYPAGSVTPRWGLIISHIRAEDRAVAEAAYGLARTRIGPFSWSHRIHAGDATPLDPDGRGDIRVRQGKLRQSGGTAQQRGVTSSRRCRESLPCGLCDRLDCAQG